MLLRPLPEELARSISAYVGCIAGASLLNDYLTTALDAGLRDLAIPRIAIGADLMAILSPENATSGSSCCCAEGHKQRQEHLLRRNHLRRFAQEPQ